MTFGRPSGGPPEAKLIPDTKLLPGGRPARSLRPSPLRIKSNLVSALPLSATGIDPERQARFGQARSVGEQLGKARFDLEGDGLKLSGGLTPLTV